MNDQELRQLVRQALARNGAAVPGPGSHVPGPSSSQVLGSGAAVPVQFVSESVPFGSHVSHSMYMQLVNTSTECVIEEHVQCDHCGYCKSHGH